MSRSRGRETRMLIPREIIDRIVNEADIVSVISEAVALRKAGQSFKGLCPFHGEKTPSFIVTPGKNIFYCFGCHVGGDVLSFVMRREGLGFQEAAEKLASRLNIPIPRGPSEAPGARDERDAFHRILAYAHWHFREQYRRSETARTYVAGRGITEATAERFEIGYAPEGFGSLRDFLTEKNVPLEKAEALGLLRRHETKGNRYDFFRNRLIFPIRSARGDIVGFGGRTLSADPDQPKYINSPDSPVYHKSRELFGFHLHRSAIASSRKAVVVEGYVDAVACAQLGVAHAVAPLGTSLTAEQSATLKRVSDDVVLMFDGDEAGRKAALRAFAVCLEAGVHPRVALLPDGRDPGDCLKDETGTALLERAVEGAPFAMDWLLAKTLEKTGPTPMERASAIKSLASWIRRLPEDSMRLAYEERLSRHLGIPFRDLHKVVDNTYQKTNIPQSSAPGLANDELMVLTFIKTPELIRRHRLSELIGEAESPGLTEMARFVENYFSGEETFDGPLTISHVPEALKPVMSRLLACGDSYAETNPEDLIRRQHRRVRVEKLRRLTARILSAETTGDAAGKTALLAEKQRLLGETE